MFRGERRESRGAAPLAGRGRVAVRPDVMRRSRPASPAPGQVRSRSQLDRAATVIRQLGGPVLTSCRSSERAAATLAPAGGGRPSHSSAAAIPEGITAQKNGADEDC